MMDVLVQVATENGINAGGMMLKVPIDRPPGYLHYKPNMPIGKLGCTTVEVVPKAAVCDRPKKHAPKGSNLPFEVRGCFLSFVKQIGVEFLEFFFTQNLGGGGLRRKNPVSVSKEKFRSWKLAGWGAGLRARQHRLSE